MTKAFLISTQLNASEKLAECDVELIPGDDFFDVNMIASRWHISKRGVYRVVQRGELAPPMTIGRSARWSAEDVRTAEEAFRKERALKQGKV